MQSELLFRLILYSLCLSLFFLLSAFFSGTETAFFTLNNLEQEAFRKKKLKPRDFVKKIISQPDALLVTVLTGNLFVNVFATAFFDTYFMEILVRIFHIPGEKVFSIIALPELFSIISMTALLLVFGEMLPKNLAVRHPVSFAGYSVFPLYLTDKVLKPLTIFLNWIRGKLTPRVKRPLQEDEEIKNGLLNFSVRIGYKEKMLNRFEVDLFESYIEFREKTARDVMIPRTALEGVDISSGIGYLLELVSGIEEADSSYIYLYNKDFDHLEGFVDIKELLPYKFGLKSGDSLTPLIKPFHSIPSTKKINTLINELKERNIAIAHVVDEYGGTAGILTFDHIIEELFNYFYFSDESDFISVNRGFSRVTGKIEIEELEEKLGISFDTENRTLSGMIIDLLGEIPEAGRCINIKGVDFKIVKVSKNKILQTEVRRKD